MFAMYIHMATQKCGIQQVKIGDKSRRGFVRRHRKGVEKGLVEMHLQLLMENWGQCVKVAKGVRRKPERGFWEEGRRPEKGFCEAIVTDILPTRDVRRMLHRGTAEP
jgi:hypothetical protein